LPALREPVRPVLKEQRHEPQIPQQTGAARQVGGTPVSVPKRRDTSYSDDVSASRTARAWFCPRCRCVRPLSSTRRLPPPAKPRKHGGRSSVGGARRDRAASRGESSVDHQAGPVTFREARPEVALVQTSEWRLKAHHRYRHPGRTRRPAWWRTREQLSGGGLRVGRVMLALRPCWGE
jgi:hypothetical protein